MLKFLYTITYPTSLDTLSNPSAGELLENAVTALDHDQQHSNANDAIEALEAKVGANSSAVTTSHDYKLGEVTGSDKAVGKTATQTLTNKTLTSPILNLSSNATGDIYYRASDGTLGRLPIGTTGNILDVSAGGIPEWVANPSASDASTTTKGVVKLSVAPASATNPIAVGDNDPRLSNPSFSVQDIPLSSGTTTNTIFALSQNTDKTIFVAIYQYGATNALAISRLVKDSVTGNLYITHTTTLTGLTAIQGTEGVAIAGNYVYVTAVIGGVNAYRRYDLADLANVTTITISGTPRGGPMFSDGTNLYVYNTTDTVTKFTISGTTITNNSDITYTSSGTIKCCACDGTNVWLSNGAGTGAMAIRKYPLAGGTNTSVLSIILNSNAYYNATGTAAYPTFAVVGTNTICIGWGYNNVSPTAIVGLNAHLMAISL